MVFGWTQVAVDSQPLAADIARPLGYEQIQYHGFSHTYVGATLLAVFSAITGKYLAELVLNIVKRNGTQPIRISWSVAFLSAFLGAYSHVFLDSLVHSDMAPFYPASHANPFMGVVPSHWVLAACVLMGVVGAVLYFARGSAQSGAHQPAEPRPVKCRARPDVSGSDAK